MPYTKKYSYSQFVDDFRFKFTQSQIMLAHQNDLSLSQFNSLILVNHHSSVTINELSSFLFLAISSTSRLVDGLVEKGLVNKQSAAHSDMRCKKLTLTEAGKRLIAKAHKDFLLLPELNEQQNTTETVPNGLQNETSVDLHIDINHKR